MKIETQTEKYTSFLLEGGEGGAVTVERDGNRLTIGSSAGTMVMEKR
ncbi:hypothetical protein IH992_34345 [Candidatus Poribacteria bacterium]|nr:hypothetical protein [Candidatus Poribacteria bacterium]